MILTEHHWGLHSVNFPTIVSKHAFIVYTEMTSTPPSLHFFPHLFIFLPPSPVFLLPFFFPFPFFFFFLLFLVNCGIFLKGRSKWKSQIFHAFLSHLGIQRVPLYYLLIQKLQRIKTGLLFDFTPAPVILFLSHYLWKKKHSDQQRQ